ncbi:PhaM family polyhydroxyalkanoate granule multifunctional regulatory protein, partial [Bordetella petrii]|uniref:PhaM family polyhydroxyalkanoate granule multifunctional regulatory protein n=1 Tax=Bordetella petrii TaxID=94624 RepID=UPI001E36F76D
MPESNTNPFVLPGLGQDGDLSGNPLLASMEMMRKAWAGLAGPGGLAQSLPMGPPMNLEDLERRIADLRTVENWLRMNLSMLSSAIQGLEVQRATIATLRSFVGGAAATGEASPLEVALGLKPAPAAHSATPFGSGQQAAAAGDAAGSSATADQVNQAAQSASQAWWNLLQQQFNQIASATAASMPEAARTPPPAGA